MTKAYDEALRAVRSIANQDNSKENTMPTVKEMQLAISTAIINEALTMGYDISVYDSEEFTLKKSTVTADILAAMFKSGGDTLHLSSINGRGNIKFVWGLNGYDCIEDFSPELETVVFPGLRIAERYRG